MRWTTSTVDPTADPYFVEELLASGVHEDRFLPSSLRDVLLARVDALEPSAQDLLAVAAIGGREVDHDLLVAVAGRPDRDSTDDIRVLVDAGLLVPLSAPDHDGYAFRHALLPPERRRLHRAYAERLQEREDAGSADASLLLRLAHHWREARDPRALEASIRAGDAASASYAYANAVGEYDHALALWDDMERPRDDGLDHVELLARAGRTAYLAGQNRRSATVARQAMNELGEGADGARRAELGFLLGPALWVTGDWRASLKAYEQAMEAAPPPPHLARIRALAGLGQAYMLFGWLGRSRRLCEEAVELARSVGARDLEGHALNSLSVSLAGMGESEAAISAIDEALAIGEELGIPDDIGRAFVNRGDILSWAGYPDRALESTLQGIRTTLDLGIESSYGTYLRINGVMFAYVIGEWDQAGELLARAGRSADASDGTESYRAEYALGLLVSSGDPDATPTDAREAPTQRHHALDVHGRGRGCLLRRSGRGRGAARS
jgi:tetratricopeptide (TPR) repeat protein